MSDTPMAVEFFVPGQTKSLVNSRTHWTKKAAVAKDAKERTAMYARVASRRCPWATDLTRPKRVSFFISTRSLMDDDNLPASVKSIRDGLIGIVLKGDAKKDGNAFEYDQKIDRRNPGVKIRIELLNTEATR